MKIKNMKKKIKKKKAFSYRSFFLSKKKKNILKEKAKIFFFHVLFRSIKVSILLSNAYSLYFHIRNYSSKNR